ncbi:MAG TPA: DUF1893 domain-containing protein [Candidatus Olsenella avicola]|uniref:DUF1893 domain-containing protein n=1 Tax=Olsenella sp. An285 TaxID=1965621 RepID=UPI000B39B78B|nr:DUF1893 domain-containing protein [Olsenella sp. An285]OUO46615.1 hypothetical protein B5F79_06760 [Olsenella sp. An285]HIY50402.1 DUF1893 domain-containing protein [Candidatus Olsenella avicola]
MDATDLDLARALLIANRDATLVAVRGDEIHVCHERGVKPLLKMIKEGRSLRGFAVADKVVGKAPALLYAVLGPEAVFSPVMSWTGRAVLLASGIATSYDTLVRHIQNRAKTGQCPMDSSVTNVWEPYEAVGVLMDRAQQMALGV